MYSGLNPELIVLIFLKVRGEEEIMGSIRKSPVESKIIVNYWAPIYLPIGLFTTKARSYFFHFISLVIRKINEIEI